MLIKIHIITIIFFLLSVLSFILRFTDYFSEKEGIKIGKIERFIWSIKGVIKLRLLLVALIPVVNIVFAMFYIFASDDSLEDLRNKTIAILDEEENNAK